MKRSDSKAVRNREAVRRWRERNCELIVSVSVGILGVGVILIVRFIGLFVLLRLVFLWVFVVSFVGL